MDAIPGKLQEKFVGIMSGGSVPAESMNRYRAIDQSSIPVFQQDWWLEIACKRVRRAEIRIFYGSVLVGSLPYTIRRTWIGHRWGAAPDWSHLCAPVLSPCLSHSEKADVLRRMIAELPRSISFGFTCGPQSSEASLIRNAFLAAGFEHLTERTYSQSAKENNAILRVSRKHRSRLRSAIKALTITELDEHQFVEFYAENLRKAAIKSRNSLDLARDLIAVGRRRNPSQMRVTAIGVADAQEPYDAAIACTWDNARYYYWMATRRRDLAGSVFRKPHPDAIKVLLLEAMSHAKSLGLRFDADGIGAPGADILYRDILKIPDLEFRDVFLRRTWFMRWYILLRKMMSHD